eukprot:TRINITY_DN1733_c0_g1_i1.p1 TRINITY_DN1733_c0_g1~~TRINITY_DN1733_c0_g1_i1.p1  ORF type:complete len:254 (-),score=49.44 TRINITY_DN1733_c0_g1_i1:680-1441(-)
MSSRVPNQETKKMSLTIHSFANDIRVAKVLASAHLSKIELEVQEIDPTVTSTDEQSNPSGKLPFLRTEQGTISGTNTILRYICSRGGLYSGDAFTTSLIDAWIDWSGIITLISASWLYPIWGLEQENEVNRDISALNLFRELSKLNSHLNGKNFLVGDSFSLADISVAFSLLDLYTTVLDFEFRAHFPQVGKWLTSVLEKEEIKAVIGPIDFCNTPITPSLPKEIFSGMTLFYSSTFFSGNFFAIWKVEDSSY